MRVSMTLRTYSGAWLGIVKPTLRPSSWRAYERALRVAALPALGDLALEQVTRPRLKAWFSGLLGHYTPRSAGQALGVVRVVLASAVEDELIPVNPASGLRRAMRVGRGDHEVEALTADELRRFLEAAQAGEDFLGLLILALTGVRIGEAAGLQWGDVDFGAKVLRIRRQLYADGTSWPLKTRSGRRDVDLASVLADELRRVKADRDREHARYSIPDSPDTRILYPEAQRGNVVRHALSDAMSAALKRAGLAARLSCHGLRHTFASLMLARGESVQYVQRALGHATVAMTCDVYGRWLPLRAQRGGPNALLGESDR